MNTERNQSPQDPHAGVGPESTSTGGDPTQDGVGRIGGAERISSGGVEGSDGTDGRESAAEAPTDDRGAHSGSDSGGVLPQSLRHALVGWLGAFTVIAATWRLFEYQDLIFAFASLGGSAVIVFGMPDTPMAQPRSLFGGHAVASIVGIAFYSWFGANTWSIAAAMATSLFAMQLIRVVHSPAGADPIIIMTSGVSGHLVMLNLSVGLLVLWFVAVVLLNGLRIDPYCRDVHRKLIDLVARSANRAKSGVRRRGR